MKTNVNEPTMTYKYGNNEKEYVFCVKGRPFPCLVSPYIPTPTATLLDYHLVKDLGLQMKDLQCQKFSFCGHKLRILGKVSITVQCIHDGVSSGAFHIKANVILDLAKNLDTECVAGAKMAAQLSGDSPPSALSTPRATPPPGQGARSPAPAVPAPAPRTPPPRSAGPSTRSPPRSPPGFPTPRYPSTSPGTPEVATVPVLRLEADGRQMSPRAANIRALGTAFNNADLQTDEDEMTWALEEIDSEGGYNAMAYDNDGYDYTFQLRNGLKYNYGHGRNRCSYVKCTDPEKYAVQGFPANCAFNKAWWLPDQFKPCGDKCEGAFCYCLRWYQPGFPVYQPLQR